MWVGEATATIYHRNRDSQRFPELKRDATDAGITAGKARRVIEEDIGQSVVTQENHLLKKLKSKQKKEQKRLQENTSPSLFDELADRDTSE